MTVLAVSAGGYDAVVDVQQSSHEMKYYGRYVTPFEIEVPDMDVRLTAHYGTQVQETVFAITGNRVEWNFSGFVPLASDWERLVHKWNYLSATQQKLIKLGGAVVPIVAFSIFLLRK